MSGSYIYPLKRVFLNLSGGTVTGDTVFTQSIYANILTGGTYYSGSTLLDVIITNIAQSVVTGSASTLTTAVQPGSNITTGGTLLVPIVSTVASPSFNNLYSSGDSQFNIFTSVSISGGTISGGTIFSGGTNLQNTFNLFNTQLQAKANRSGDTFAGQVNAIAISATTLSADTINSGSTNLYSIFQQIGTDVQTAVQPGSNITTGGTLNVPFINVVASPSFNNLISSGSSQLNSVSIVTFSAGTVSGGTLISGSTNLNLIFQPLGNNSVVSNGTNTYTGGTFFNQTVNVSALTINTLVVSGTTQLGATTASSFSGGTVSGGTLFSGSTNLYSIFQQIGTDVQTAVQPGSNITTGGTALLPIISTISSPSFNNLFSSGASQLNVIAAVSISANTVSGGTLFSGSTNLYSIFQQIGTDVQTAVQPGSNITTGGTLSIPIISVVSSPSFNNLISSGSSQLGTTTASSLSGGTVSGGTIFSGSTNLQSIFNSVNSQLETKANLSGATFTGAISASAITDSQLITGEVVYAGVGGLLKSNSGFTYDDSIGALYTNNFQVGSPSLSGTVTVWGNVNVMGHAVSAFTTELLIQDNNITLNYNPTASTVSTSLGSGFDIQDGSGIPGTDVFFEIRGSGATIYNRSFATNLMDIRIRESGTTSSPNGVRVLAEQDLLDGGSF